MEAHYWDERYRQRLTGWDMKQVSPPLKAYVDTLPSKDIDILIPGCGHAYEADYLLDQGFRHITLIDISAVPTDKLREKYRHTPVQVICGDFFKHRGRYHLILEQTFFCALHPSLRQDYVHHSHGLLHKEGIIAGVLFHKKASSEEPPYVASREEYVELFSNTFDILKMEECHDSIAPRMGSELSFIFRKKN